MRQPIIIGNWKMNMLMADALTFIEQINELNDSQATVGIAPQFPILANMIEKKENILIGAQNTSQFLSGAYTGEVSADLLAEIKADFCIIGHSERRMMFNETNEAVNEKAKTLQLKKITPVICVGETEEAYDKGDTEKVISDQIKACCKELDIEKCVVAYEPIWAIGTGKSADENIAQKVCQQIRAILSTMYDNETAEKVRVIYGGSVNEKNIQEYMNQKDIDGALVGGASLKVESFSKLINYKK